MYRLIFSLILFIVLWGCKSSNDLESARFVIDISTWKESDIVIPEKIIKNVKFIALETKKDVLLAGIRKLIMTEEKIYVLDRKSNIKVFVFDINGKYITSIGKYGKGPGELISLTDFIVDEDSNLLYVLDSDNRKVLLYDLRSGKYLSDFKIIFFSTEFEKADNNSIIFYVQYPIKGIRKEYAIAIMNLIDKSYRWFLEKDDYYIRISSPYSIFQSEKTFFAPFLKDIVYEVKSNGVIPYIKFNYGQSKLPKDLIKKMKVDPKVIKEVFGQKTEFSFGIKNVLENDKFITFNISVKGKPCMAIYSKETQNINHGSRYGNIFGYTENLTVFNNKFISSINANLFIMMEKRIIENGDSNLKEEYFSTIKLVNDNSNPIILKIEYNTLK